MREVKFRAWDGKHWTTLGMFITGNDMRIFGVSQHEGIILMQFTGLLDKNGKDIYEGDIVKGGTRYMRHVKKKYSISVIEYRGAGFWVKDEDFGWEGENLWSWDDLEVIGNIYENPELIADGNKNKSTK